MRTHQKLLRDPLAYTSHIGKQDRRHTIDALHEQGRNTVVRLCFTPSEYGAPLRLLGYIAAAQHITRNFLPDAQLQVVAPVHASARINHTALPRTMQVARQVFESTLAQPALQRSRPDRMLFGFDKPGEHPRLQVDRIAPLTRHYSEAATLSASARARKASYPAYVAAHLVLHDMIDCVIVDPAFASEQPDTSARRIISIGALSEQAFHAARMRCRRAPYFETDDMAAATGQIFTRHVLPPYNFSRHASIEWPEPRLEDPPTNAGHLREVAVREGQLLKLTSLDRDLKHFRQFTDYYAPVEPAGSSTVRPAG
jgi:hypothetical protein